VAGAVHAVTLLVILLLAAPLARFVPLATLAAILVVVAYNMSEWRETAGIWRLGWTDTSVWLVTFALTVFADLTVAVEAGMALAGLLYIHRVTETTSVAPVTHDDIRGARAHILQDKSVPPYVTILRIHGPFLFGTTEKLAAATADLAHFSPIVIIRLRNMTAIDATGLHALADLCRRLKASGRVMIVCGAREQPSRVLAQTDFLDLIGIENVAPNIDVALKRADEVHVRFGGMGEEVARDFATARL
jgi:SulP family sulfate permease